MHTLFGNVEIIKVYRQLRVKVSASEDWDRVGAEIVLLPFSHMAFGTAWIHLHYYFDGLKMQITCSGSKPHQLGHTAQSDPCSFGKYGDQPEKREGSIWKGQERVSIVQLHGWSEGKITLNPGVLKMVKKTYLNWWSLPKFYASNSIIPYCCKIVILEYSWFNTVAIQGICSNMVSLDCPTLFGGV